MLAQTAQTASPHLLQMTRNICEIKLYYQVGPDRQKNLYCSDKNLLSMLVLEVKPGLKRIIY